MRSRIDFTIYPSGTLDTVATKGDKLFQGNVGTAEYVLRMADTDDAENWLPHDNVFIAFVRPDKAATDHLMTRKGDTWIYLSNGWETDVDVGEGGSELKVSFICRRFTSDRKLVSTKTSEQVALTILPSAGYTPLEMSDEKAEAILTSVKFLNDDFVALEDVVLLRDQVTATSKEVEAGDEPTVVVSDDAITRKVNFEFGIPKGNAGQTGATGQIGATPNIQVEVKELVQGSQPTVVKSGTNEEPLLTFGIPKQIIEGNGVYAMAIEDGNLFIYSQDVKGATFSMDEDGDLCIEMEGGV